MTVPRIARIHLVYQFIILTLLIFIVGYSEILQDKKCLFLALIPVFFYQLVIVFCCTELLPLPGWITVQEHAFGSIKDEDIHIETKAPSVENLEPIQNPVQSSESIFPKKLSSFKKSLKNRKTEIVSTKVLEAQEINTCSTELLNNITVSKPNSRQGEIESTKCYFFPYCQKRSEESLEQNEIIRPCKVRNVKYGNEKNSFFNEKNPVQTGHIDEQKSTIESGNNNQIDENEITHLKKSRSFPFRQKRLDKFLDCEENLENDLNDPWKALNYTKSVSPSKRKRKSVSTEALHDELESIKPSCKQKSKNYFTQSMELTGTLSLDSCAVKNPLKPTKSFNKFKQGIVNRFNKNKRESFKTDETKQNVENITFFRELSNENLNLESAEREKSAKQIKFTKPENRSKFFQYSYVSYVNDSFTDDVKEYSNPKNFKKIFL